MLFVVEKLSPMNKEVKVKLDTTNNVIDKASDISRFLCEYTVKR